MWYLLAITFAGFPPISLSMAMVSASPDVPHLEMIRTWTDASGKRQARAVLLRSDGLRLWLRTENGREVSTMISKLSTADKAYVSAQNPLSESLAQLDLLGVASRLKWQPRLPTFKDAIAHLESNYDNKERLVPAVLVYVKVSRDFLNDFIEGSISTQKPLRDCILGTSISGQSHTTGELKLLLRPSLGKLSGEVAFDGTVHSRSTGYNGPAIIHSVTDSRFRARKPVHVSASGIQTEPAKASVNTNLTTTGIGSTLPRLRGRIARRIAQRRNAASHNEAESISAAHTAKRIRDDLDSRTDKALARVQKYVAEVFPISDLEFENRKSEFRFRSTSENVELGMIVVEGVSAESLRLRPPAVVGHPDLAIRINRALLDDATNAGLEQIQDVAQLFVDSVKSGLALNVAAKMNASNNELIKWQLEPNWLMIDYTGSLKGAPTNQQSKRVSIGTLSR